jgi:hypothetical protein
MIAATRRIDDSCFEPPSSCFCLVWGQLFVGRLRRRKLGSGEERKE